MWECGASARTRPLCRSDAKRGIFALCGTVTSAPRPDTSETTRDVKNRLLFRYGFGASLLSNDKNQPFRMRSRVVAFFNAELGYNWHLSNTFVWEPE